jgi:hypothetical protein
MNCDKRQHVISRSYQDTVMMAYSRCLVWTMDNEEEAVDNTELWKWCQKTVEKDEKS